MRAGASSSSHRATSTPIARTIHLHQERVHLFAARFLAEHEGKAFRDFRCIALRENVWCPC